MDDIKVLFSQVTDLIFNEVSNKLDENASVVDGKMNDMYQSVRSLESKIVDIVKDVSELKDEFSNYQRVSIVSNLNNQIRGKDRELTQLRKQLEKSTENVVKVTHPPVEIPVEETTEEHDNLVTTVEEQVTTTEDVIETTAIEEEVVEEVAEEEEAVAEEEEAGAEEEEAGAEEEEAGAEEEEAGAEVEEAGAEGAEEEEEDDEEGVSLIEKMLKDPKTGKRKKFLITEDSDKDIYDIDADGDPGEEPIGKLTGKTIVLLGFN